MSHYLITYSFFLSIVGITSAAGIVAAMSDPKRFDGPALPSPSKQPPKHQSWIQRATGSGTPIEVFCTQFAVLLFFVLIVQITPNNSVIRHGVTQEIRFYQSRLLQLTYDNTRSQTRVVFT